MRENGRAGGTAEAQGPGGLEKSVDYACFQLHCSYSGSLTYFFKNT